MTDPNKYTLTVVFDRYQNEDETTARERHPGLPLKEALLQQLRDELQDAFDAGYISGGFFNIIKIEGV